MGSAASQRVHRLAKFRYVPGLACMLAYAAAAGPEPPPKAAGSGPVLEFDESPSSRVLYIQESGGLMAPIAKPLPGNVRSPLPPLPGRDAKASTPRPPTTHKDPAAGKARLDKALAAPRTPAAVAPAPAAAVPLAKSEEDLRLDRRREYDALVARLATEASTPAERARRITEATGPLIVSYQDVSTAVRLGWLWLEGKDPASAVQWFQRARTWRAGDEEATRGLAFATLAERNYAAALALADEMPVDSTVGANVRREAWIGIGQREYGAEHYRGAIDAFDRAAASGELPRYVRLLRAWSRLKMGDKANAAADFAILYRESPDLESAQGVIAAAPSGALPANTLAASTEPLTSMLRARAGEAAFRSHRYLEARSLDPARWSSLGSPGVLAATGAVGRREKTGEGGLGKLKADIAPGGGISVPAGEYAAVSVSTDRVRLDASERAPNALVGTAPAGVSLPASGMPVRAAVRETTLNLQMEREITLVASAGSGVRGGAVGARPVGSVAVFATPAWGQADARAFVEPVRESILSWAGMADPHGGPAWGGVRRLGVEARALYLGFSPYSAGLHARTERLVGTRVAGNERRAFDASIGRDLGLSGFAYSSLGLTVGVDAYNRNLSHYTVGHGGYFSPQSYRKAGVAFDFMTEEGKRWLVRGRAATARNWKHEDASALFPLDPDGRIYQGSRSKGHEASIRVGVVAQVSPRVQVGLAIGRSISPQSSEKVALLEVRVLFDPRRGVVSADLPAARGE